MANGRCDIASNITLFSYRLVFFSIISYVSYSLGLTGDYKLSLSVYPLNIIEFYIFIECVGPRVGNWG